jgi:hypothetical protein
MPTSDARAALPSRFDEVDRQLQKILVAQAQLQDAFAAFVEVQAQQSTILQLILDDVQAAPTPTTFVIEEQKES